MICNLCPRKCNACRTEHQGNGFCGAGTLPVVARVAPHFGEEPCISGTKGSGTVFFSGCTLQCKACFNKELWDFNAGKVFSKEVYENEIKPKVNEHITNYRKQFMRKKIDNNEI